MNTKAQYSCIILILYYNKSQGEYFLALMSVCCCTVQKGGVIFKIRNGHSSIMLRHIMLRP